MTRPATCDILLLMKNSTTWFEQRAGAEAFAAEQRAQGAETWSLEAHGVYVVFTQTSGE